MPIPLSREEFRVMTWYHNWSNVKQGVRWSGRHVLYHFWDEKQKYCCDEQLKRSYCEWGVSNKQNAAFVMLKELASCWKICIPLTRCILFFFMIHICADEVGTDVFWTNTGLRTYDGNCQAIEGCMSRDIFVILVFSGLLAAVVCGSRLIPKWWRYPWLSSNWFFESVIREIPRT